jgi:hypothetical protein
MQRKNNFLRINLKSSRSGIAMIMAIAVILIISTIMALSLSLTATTAKRTTDLYLHEQAILVSKSAAEIILLEIAANDPCDVNSSSAALNYTSNGIFDVNVTLKYVYTAPSPCSAAVDKYFDISTDEQNGSVLMDIIVTTNEGTEPIRYFRRSIQKL